MQSEKNAVYQHLKSHSTLLDMLASNTPYWDPNGAESKANSIMPAGAATANTKAPFITIQGGGEVQLGERYAVQTMYIRVYDQRPKFYVVIDRIMQKVKSVLDFADLSVPPSQLVKIRYESSLGELSDEPINLNFRESVFRIETVQVDPPPATVTSEPVSKSVVEEAIGTDTVSVQKSGGGGGGGGDPSP